MDVQPQLLLLSGDDLPRLARADGLSRAWNSGQRPDRSACDAEGDTGAGGDGEGTVGWPAIHCRRFPDHGGLLPVADAIWVFPDAGRQAAAAEFARPGKGGPAQWTVTSDTSAAAGLAIEQTSADRTDYRFPLAIYQPLLANNVDVTVRFKAVAGKVDQAGGIAVRLSDPDNYYVVRANALDDNVRFYHVVKGQRSQIEGANT